MPDRMDIRKMMRTAEKEARAMASSHVEAEHLLLALSASPRLAAGQLLCAEGLDHEAVREALALEFERSLAAAGIRIDDFSLPSRRLPLTEKPHLAQSTKLALRRALKMRAARRERQLGSLCLLLGILASERSTVTRALTAADIDRYALMDRARSALEHPA